MFLGAFFFGRQARWHECTAVIRLPCRCGRLQRNLHLKIVIQEHTEMAPAYQKTVPFGLFGILNSWCRTFLQSHPSDLQEPNVILPKARRFPAPAPPPYAPYGEAPQPQLWLVMRRIDQRRGGTATQGDLRSPDTYQLLAPFVAMPFAPFVASCYS